MADWEARCQRLEARCESLQEDVASETTRANDLFAGVERLEAALRPFAGYDITEDGAVPVAGYDWPPMRERIVDWFGWSDFVRAREALAWVRHGDNEEADDGT